MSTAPRNSTGHTLRTTGLGYVMVFVDGNDFAVGHIDGAGLFLQAEPCGDEYLTDLRSDEGVSLGAVRVPVRVALDAVSLAAADGRYGGTVRRAA